MLVVRGLQLDGRRSVWAVGATPRAGGRRVSRVSFIGKTIKPEVAVEVEGNASLRAVTSTFARKRNELREERRETN